MTCLTTRSDWKWRTSVVLAALTLILLSALLLSAPAIAQEPEPAPAAENGTGRPAGHIPPPGSTGYLNVQVYDWLTGRPLGSRTISVYNQDGEPAAQATTACEGYVEFDNLPSGAYRVVIEPDPNWITVRRSNFPGGRNTPGEWVWVRPYWRVGVSFFESPNITGAGLRVYAYLASSRQANQPREPLAGAAFTIYNANGTPVANRITGCGGFADITNLSAGDYRVVDANQPEGAYIYPPSGERWVSLEYGTLTSTWFFTVPGPGPETTPTPIP